MTRKKRKTFRIASQVPEWKKSLKPPKRSLFESVVVWATNIAILTGGFFLRATLRQTRAPRSRRARSRRARRRSGARLRSPWYGSGRSDGGEIRKEIERSCDENRTALPRDFSGMREGLGGVGNDLDVREESA